MKFRLNLDQIFFILDESKHKNVSDWRLNRSNYTVFGKDDQGTLFYYSLYEAEDIAVLLWRLYKIRQIADENFEKPSWLGEEVTHDERYYNAYLSEKPFTEW